MSILERLSGRVIFCPPGEIWLSQLEQVLMLVKSTSAGEHFMMHRNVPPEYNIIEPKTSKKLWLRNPD